MAHRNFKVLDSDIHIIEPPDLWQRYMDPAFRDRGPISLAEDAGDLRLAFQGFLDLPISEESKRKILWDKLRCVLRAACVGGM